MNSKPAITVAAIHIPITTLRNHILRGNNLMLIRGINDESAESIPNYEGTYSSIQGAAAAGAGSRHRINPPSIKQSSLPIATTSATATSMASPDCPAISVAATASTHSPRAMA
jgi:hypothetical protein